jgi:cytochrome c peroxidase
MAGPGCSKRQQAGHSDDAVVAAAALLLCSADRGQEQGKRGREKERERARFDRGKLKIFELNLKSFEYQSCSSCQNLQLWFQTFSHLRFGLKVTNSNLNAKENTLYTLFFEFFSKFGVLT